MATWNQWAKGKPFQVYDRDHIRMTAENTARAIETVLTADHKTLKELAKEGKQPNLIWLIANTVLREGEYGQFRDTNRLLDRVIGKSKQIIEIAAPADVSNDRVSFEEFCRRAGYAIPYDLQVEMMKFGIHQGGARLLLGARGYGKTDYVTIMGEAYDLYNNYLDALEAKAKWDLDPKRKKEDEPRPDLTYLLVTKSDDRNGAILNEIANACRANGVPFEKESSKALRVKGLKGKDHSVAAITIGSSSMRGRHPKKIIMDDPVTEEDVSEATRKRVKRVYNELSKLTANILIIGQPVHKFDLYEELRPLLNKMEVVHGTIPQLDHDLVAQRLAGVSEESIQASYFLKVISETGNPLEKVQYIDDFPVSSSVAFIDPSFEGGDYTAMSVLTSYFDGIAVYGKVWKRAWFDCFDEIEEVVEQRKVGRLCFETNSLGEQPVHLLRSVLEGCGVVGKKSLGSKHARIMSAGPFAKSIHLAKTSDRTYIDQIIKYEYGAKNDDAPDSLASGLEWIGLIRGKT